MILHSPHFKPSLKPWLQSRGPVESLSDLIAEAKPHGIEVHPVLIDNRPAFFRIKLPNGQAHELSSLHAARGLVSREVERQTKLKATP